MIKACQGLPRLQQERSCNTHFKHEVRGSFGARPCRSIPGPWSSCPYFHLGTRHSQCTNTVTSTNEWKGVFVNGVDQGTFQGIRIPAYNGAPPSGYANSPVKDLTSIDMRCNVLGDHQVPHTIQVAPGDNLTLDWSVLC
jgi:hypothetical protein